MEKFRTRETRSDAVLKIQARQAGCGNSDCGVWRIAGIKFRESGVGDVSVTSESWDFRRGRY
jgi:hypothetical protein